MSQIEFQLDFYVTGNVRQTVVLYDGFMHLKPQEVVDNLQRGIFATTIGHDHRGAFVIEVATGKRVATITDQEPLDDVTFVDFEAVPPSDIPVIPTAAGKPHPLIELQEATNAHIASLDNVHEKLKAVSTDFAIADPDLITRAAIVELTSKMEDTEQNVGGFVFSRHALPTLLQLCAVNGFEELPPKIFGNPYMIVPDGPAMRVISDPARRLRCGCRTRVWTRPKASPPTTQPHNPPPNPMGREIRRVPANWKHPKYTAADAPHPRRIGDYRPLKQNYQGDIDSYNKLRRKRGPKHADEYYGGQPDPSDYVDYKGQPADWWQLYETVSEGAPVSPPFATPEELIEYLVNNGDFWDQRRYKEDRGPKPGYSRKAAEAIVTDGWAPSFVVQGGQVFAGAEGLVATSPEAKPDATQEGSPS